MKIPLEIPPGLASDDTTFSSSVWSDGDNVRFWGGKPEVIGGWVDAMNGTTLTGVCRNMLAIGSGNGNATIVFGTHSALQVWQGGALYTITPSGLTTGSIDGTTGGASGYGSGAYNVGTYGSGSTTYFARTWALSTYGSYLIANPRGGGIYEWQGDTGALALIITNAPTEVTYALATPQRQVLAFGCNEEVSADFNALCIRGSDIEDNTDWTTTATNNAFEHILDAAGGRIVAARLIGPYVAVWTNVSLYLGEYIGQPEQTYRFDRIADNCGLAGPNAVEVTDNAAFWLSPDGQFRAYAVGGKPEIIPCPIGKDFRDNLETGQVDKVSASALSQFNEVCWHYPDSRDGIENSRYVSVGLSQGSGWFKGTLARTATINSGVLSYPVKATYAGMVYYHEYGNDADGAALAWELTSSDISFGDASSWLMCRGLWPDIEGQQGDISMTVSFKPYPQGTATTKGPYTLASSADKKDFLAQGRLAALSFSGADAPSWMRLGRPVFDLVPTGQQ